MHKKHGITNTVVGEISLHMKSATETGASTLLTRDQFAKTHSNSKSCGECSTRRRELLVVRLGQKTTGFNIADVQAIFANRTSGKVNS